MKTDYHELIDLWDTRLLELNWEKRDIALIPRTNGGNEKVRAFNFVSLRKNKNLNVINKWFKELEFTSVIHETKNRIWKKIFI